MSFTAGEADILRRAMGKRKDKARKQKQIMRVQLRNK